MKIAMWSGPRNLSTAMMYAFGNRPDFAAWDEPFYAPYLVKTKVQHPLFDQVLARHENDADVVGQDILNRSDNVFLKLMTFHMCDGFPKDWANGCTHFHLIRHPNRVIASYLAKREEPTLRDIGFEQQLEIYDEFPGPIIESADIRNAPERALSKLCAEIGLSFKPEMLAWPKGPKPFDGIWASHWYGAVHASTGFAGPEGELPRLSGKAAELAERAMPYYQTMKSKALTI